MDLNQVRRDQGSEIAILSIAKEILYASPVICQQLDETELQQAVGQHAQAITDRDGNTVRIKLEQASFEGMTVIVALLIWCDTDTEERMAMLESTLDAVSEGVIVTDVDGSIVYFNPALGKMEGLQGKDVVGRYLTDVYQVTPDTSENLTVVKTGKPIKEHANLHFTAEGREINLVSNTFPVYHQDKIIGAFSVCRDVTRIKDLMNKNILLQKQMQTDNGETNSKKNGTHYNFQNLIYASDKMDEVVQVAKKAAATDSAIFVCGETGTGKEVLVQSIHNDGVRWEEPFVGVNCAAIPDTLLEIILFGTVKGAFTGSADSTGLFKQAGHGTLFLDEINSMSPSLQAKLLRVLQERTFRRVGEFKEQLIDCRIISSTNVDPGECIKNGSLREDLYYRFAVFTLVIPPLRERPEDIKKLASYFIHRYSKVYGQGGVCLDPQLQQAFMLYQWPGNIRELEHIIESSLAMLEHDENVITFDHLPAYVRPKFISKKRPLNLSYSGDQSSLHEILQKTERQVILDVLRSNRWNDTRAARSLGILRQNLQYRMRKLGIRSDGLA
jgi:arginine utilization regulatory protein